MKALLLLTLMLAILGASANASTLSISFDQPDQVASPGETLQFFGAITNNSADTIFLINDDLNLLGLSLTTNDLFFTTVPVSLAASGQPGDSSGDIELFDVTVSSPLLDAPGKYLGTYTLFGGLDGGAQDNLGSAHFSVTTAPEPSTFDLLFGVGAAALVLWSIRSRRTLKAIAGEPSAGSNRT